MVHSWLVTTQGGVVGVAEGVEEDSVVEDSVVEDSVVEDSVVEDSVVEDSSVVVEDSVELGSVEDVEVVVASAVDVALLRLSVRSRTKPLHWPGISIFNVPVGQGKSTPS